jgi:DNA modification methylase
MTLTLHHGDCLELMKTLPDKSVDLFLCDLPYGSLTQQKGASNSGCAWDIPIDLAAFWVQVKRLCKNDHTPVLMFCTAKFGYELIKSNEDWFRYDLVWDKTRGISFLSANKMPMRSHELIYVFSKKGANYTRIDEDDPTKKARKTKGRELSGSVYNPQTNRGVRLKCLSDMPQGKRCSVSIIQAGVKPHTKGMHPTQKPDPLYEWLIIRYSKEGDTILDPTAGSFASCFNAQRLNRNAIGIEKDEGFFTKAKSLAEK